VHVAPSESRITAIVDVREDMGSEVYLHIPALAPPVLTDSVKEALEEAAEEQQSFVARVGRATVARESEPIELVVDTSRLHFFDLASGAGIYK
jgi:multiple sugar transport system ATP-binding protein